MATGTPPATVASARPSTRASIELAPSTREFCGARRDVLTDLDPVARIDAVVGGHQERNLIHRQLSQSDINGHGSVGGARGQGDDHGGESGMADRFDEHAHRPPPYCDMESR